MATPTIAQAEPFRATVKAGRSYWWCACGLSRNQPFCDGSHKDTDFEPVQYTAKKDGDIWFCGCKHTKKQPICDGTHSGL